MLDYDPAQADTTSLVMYTTRMFSMGLRLCRHSLRRMKAQTSVCTGTEHLRRSASVPPSPSSQ